MSVASKFVGLFADMLGKTLRVSSAGTLDVVLSGDAGQTLGVGSDGGLIVTSSSISQAALPSVAASDNGKLMTVVAGAWAKAAPTGLSLLGCTTYTSSTTGVNLQAVLTALSYASSVKGFSLQCVGGGASGRSGGNSSAATGGQGGMPGAVEDTPVYPLSLLASLTNVDVTVGAGGASYSTGNNYSNNNAGAASSIALHANGTKLILAPGGFANTFGTSGNPWYAICTNAGYPVTLSMRYIPSIPQGDAGNGSYPLNATLAGFGPGAGGTGAYSSGFGLGGGAKGGAEVTGTASFGSIYTQPATTAGAAGTAAATDRTFGSGGNGGASSGTTTGGNGGFPGGGGGGSYSAAASGSGGAGVVRVFWWG